MKIGIFDLEMSGFFADGAILLCCSSKQYENKAITCVRADSFPNWKKNRTDEKDFIQAVCDELDKYDILIAHNGERFDKKFLNAKCLQYKIKPILRFKKLIDPVQLSWRHLKLGRNTLAALIDYLEIPVKKTPIELHKWMKASMEGHKPSMDLICEHCDYDVKTLEFVYDRLRCLIDKIDNRGSAF
jgi:uncharacterized protein YprB with RNaseH-like and TPR domain